MARRHKIALEFQQGACNPIPMITELAKAKDEVIAEYPGGIYQVRTDPAIRLIMHQLNFIMGVSMMYPEWESDMGACEEAVNGQSKA